MLEAGVRVTQIAPGAVQTEFALVRMKGDESSATRVYDGYKPLTPDDIAGIIYYVATLPEHVCINDLVVVSTAQANTVHWHKKQ